MRYLVSTRSLMSHFMFFQETQRLFLPLFVIYEKFHLEKLEIIHYDDISILFDMFPLSSALSN